MLIISQSKDGLPSFDVITIGRRSVGEITKVVAQWLVRETSGYGFAPRDSSLAQAAEYQVECRDYTRCSLGCNLRSFVGVIPLLQKSSGESWNLVVWLHMPGELSEPSEVILKWWSNTQRQDGLTEQASDEVAEVKTIVSTFATLPSYLRSSLS